MGDPSTEMLSLGGFLAWVIFMRHDLYAFRSGRVSWSSFGWSLRLVGKHLSLGLSQAYTTEYHLRRE